MSVKRPLKVVIYWHMHQPEYRDLRTGEYQLPWTYLHTIKDYVDMVAHLEALPEARAVVNFAPILLEQIDDYAQQVRGFLQNSAAIRDPLLAALAGPALPAAPEQRISLIKSCLRANEERLINRFTPYKRLAAMAEWMIAHADTVMYAADQYYADLLVWYHLAWMAETVRTDDPRIRKLMKKQRGYTLHDRRELLDIIGGLCATVIGRYRVLAEAGRIELSMTPYAHPIVPLLLDLKSAHEAMPDAPLPLLEKYPDGEARARWHLQKGIETFKHFFGFLPQGCWPSEGSISEQTLKLLSEFGFRWAASGEAVMHNSLKVSGLAVEDSGSSNHQAYLLDGSDTACFFRNDGLSDLIGFTYSDWHADDAVANLVHHLENIDNSRASHSDAIVSIILDGENAWEHYPENGYHFLSALYKALANHADLELTTYSEYLADKDTQPVKLPHIVAGSWVYGTFSTWIGDTDKNRGWDMLGDAKHSFDSILSSGRLNDDHVKAAEQQLAICEGSDWFWWFGDYNPAQTVSDFERLYRVHLANLYQYLGLEPPAYLSHTFTHGSGTPAMGGAMRPGHEQA